MSIRPTDEHKLGEPWSDEQVAELVKGLGERAELEAIDLIAWLRAEPARARGALPGAKRPKARREKMRQPQWRSLGRRSAEHELDDRNASAPRCRRHHAGDDPGDHHVH